MLSLDTWEKRSASRSHEEFGDSMENCSSVSFCLSWMMFISSATTQKSCPIVLSPDLLPSFRYSNIFICFLYCVAQNCTIVEVRQHHDECSGTSASFYQLSYTVLNAPRILFAFWLTGHTVDSYWVYYHSESPDPFLQGALQPLVSESKCTPRIILSQVQNLAIILVKFHIISDYPVL